MSAPKIEGTGSELVDQHVVILSQANMQGNSKLKSTLVLFYFKLSELYVGHCQTSMMKLFCKNSEHVLAGNCFRKKLHHRFLTRF